MATVEERMFAIGGEYDDLKLAGSIKEYDGAIWQVKLRSNRLKISGFGVVVY